jgi:hypothetical protein
MVPTDCFFNLIFNLIRNVVRGDDTGEALDKCRSSKAGQLSAYFETLSRCRIFHTGE